MMPQGPPRQAFTLVELLVVMAIIGILVLLLVPAVNAAREAARRASCVNNLRQIAIATQNFESAHQRYPSSRAGLGGWSAHAQLLGFIEEDVLADQIDYDLSYSDVYTLGGERLSSYRVHAFLCPSEPHDRVRMTDDAEPRPKYYSLSYGFNMGRWLVWNPGKRRGGEGVFAPGKGRRTSHVRDGLSKTLCLAEVKAYTPYERNAGVADELSMPLTDEDLPAGGESKYGPPMAKNTGHTEWVDGRVHQTGFTTTFGPNAVVSPGRVGGRDIDWTNLQEGKSETVVTYAAVTARSHHPGLVNVAMLDGAVRAVTDDVELSIWQAASTRRGHETTDLADE